LQTRATYFGGFNAIAVPAMGTCPAHMWIYDINTQSPIAITNLGGMIYDNGNYNIVGALVLGEISPVPNPPCLYIIYPPTPLPYPLYNIFQEGTS
jgi:hypothetical protein